MSKIYLSSANALGEERTALIEKLDSIFENEQLVMSTDPWSNKYFPIKSIKHFIQNSPTYKAESVNLMVWFDYLDNCLSIKNISNGRTFHIRIAHKKYLEDFPYIYEGKPKKPSDYIIPIKFK